ncbi:MAG: UDP-glucose 4-epimerase GalE [Gammaproteobacteria bacterium]
MSSLLVTGGAGYIGSHMCVELLQAGHAVTVVDNLCNGSRSAVLAVERITQRQVEFVECDLRDRAALDALFERQSFDAVLHFAGLKAVGESVQKPLLYYDNNVNGTVALLDSMARHGVHRLVFSSSATVYGTPEQMPIDETFPTAPINPYGRTKLQIEDILRDLADSEPQWRIAMLRYFNPVGAHASGEIGEDPNGIPNNLMPFVAQVAVGRRNRLQIFGGDYDTHDGTGVRDYIHVVDLVRGHLRALEFLAANPGCHVYNLGTGSGQSVLDMVRAFERASGRKIPFEVVARRAGDAAISYADPRRAERDLKWRALLDVDAMCQDTWRWQSQHPNGFADSAQAH